MDLSTWQGKSLAELWEVKVKGTIRRQFLSKIYKRFSKSTVKVSQKKWEIAQKGELEFHKNNDYRVTGDFEYDTKLLFESFGFSPNDFDGKTILDLGAGSKLRTKFFKNADIIAIEPLIDNFKHLAHFDISDSKAYYSVGIEQYISELENSVDYALSINVLDHCLDFELCIKNIFRYLKPGAEAFLSFDCHFYTDALHPLILTKQVCTPIFENAGFSISKFTEGHSGAYQEKMKNNSYGHGVSCLNYWVKKPF